MRVEDSQRFSLALTELAAQFGIEVTGPRIALYFAGLEDLALEDIRRGLTIVARRSRFFPSVAEIREATVGAVEDRALLAWQAVLRVARGERGEETVDAIGLEAVARLGGWRHVEQYPTEPRALLPLQQEFVRLYGVVDRQSASRPAIEGRERKALTSG